MLNSGKQLLTLRASHWMNWMNSGINVDTQVISYVMESCALRKLDGGLSQLASADETSVTWLTSYRI